jgi:alkyldihydroxyacetonephosphate synthase
VRLLRTILDVARRWWGWGDENGACPVAADFWPWLERRLGGPFRPARPVALDSFRLPRPRPLAAGVMPDIPVETSADVRLAHAAGKSYLDLVRLRQGRIAHAPDVVVFPSSAKEIAAVLQAAEAHGWAVVPFGGGTSVVGGVDPIAGDRDGVICLDLSRCTGLLDLDRASMRATFCAGTAGPDVEAALAAQGYTLGHYPQSFEYSTVGGWVATRSAGQFSTRYGRIEDMVCALRVVAPRGEIRTFDDPASAAGPDLRRLLIGSEGVLGVLAEITLRIRRRPRERWFRSFLFESFDEGVDAVRAIMTAGYRPALVRLSDPPETEFGRVLSGAGGFRWRLVKWFRPGAARGAHLLLGSEDSDDAAFADFRRACALAQDHAALSAGPGPGRHWFAHRFAHPYLRDDLMDRSVFVETYETAAPWARIKRLYAGARRALEETVRKFHHEPIVLCHLSHAYPDGASLYFTVLSLVRDGEEEELWARLKRASCDAFVDHGGTVTHHHAVGTAHRPWLEREHGAWYAQALRAVKAALDPQGVLNPAKLV